MVHCEPHEQISWAEFQYVIDDYGGLLSYLFFESDFEWIHSYFYTSLIMIQPDLFPLFIQIYILKFLMMQTS